MPSPVVAVFEIVKYYICLVEDVNYNSTIAKDECEKGMPPTHPTFR